MILADVLLLRIDGEIENLHIYLLFSWSPLFILDLVRLLLSLSLSLSLSPCSSLLNLAHRVDSAAKFASGSWFQEQLPGSCRLSRSHEWHSEWRFPAPFQSLSQLKVLKHFSIKTIEAKVLQVQNLVLPEDVDFVDLFERVS